MTLDIHEANREILFFFGAGASVPAGVKDVR
jgi:NAD-dependent SIR2 family protein deacetylase